MISELSGMTEGEQRCHDALLQAYSEFVKLDTVHRDEVREFADAVHTVQNILCYRIVNRDYPKFWRPNS